MDRNALPIFSGHSDGGPEDAAPPYQVRAENFLFLGAIFESEAIRSALPPELQPSGSGGGFFASYSAPVGWGLTPYSCCFVAVEVHGYDAPDGSPGYFMVEGYYSGRAGRIMHDDYNLRLGPGWSRQFRDGSVWVGEGGAVGSPAIRIAIRPHRRASPVTAGVHHYLGQNPLGGINAYSVAFSADFDEAEPVSCDLLDGASHLMRSMTPRALTGGYFFSNISLTFSPPRLLSESASTAAYDAARVSLLDLLSRLGRAAAIVSLSGRVLYVNVEAREITGGTIRVGGTHMPSSAGARNRALSGGPIPDPILMEPSELGRPLIVQELPLGTALAGEPAVLLLVEDIMAPGRDARPTLELLGLTQAEARVAVLVGSGKSARETAGLLGVAESTARSALQIVYDKLGIGKQSELARIVTRLERLAAGPSTATLRAFGS